MKLSMLNVAIIVVFVALGTAMLFELLSKVSRSRNRLTDSEVADRIYRHIDGTEGPYDWDRFTSVPIHDRRLDAIRLACIQLDSPAPIPEEKIECLRKLAEELTHSPDKHL